jgi:TrmH family RNA methyltransferase
MLWVGHNGGIVSKNNIYYVLVEPKEGGNVGAAARAIKNMGFRNLLLAGPCDYLTDEAYRFAHGAVDVLEGAAVYDSFSSALSDKSIVIGMSRRFGSTRGLRLPVAECAKYAFDMANTAKVAIVFGREGNGLLNEEIEACGMLSFIPSSDGQPSLNLAQAVMVVAYEIARQYGQAGSTAPSHELIDNSGLSLLYERADRVLGLLGYGFRGSEDLRGGIIRNVRHLIGRASLTHWELNMLYGICTRIEEKIKGDV